MVIDAHKIYLISFLFFLKTNDCKIIINTSRINEIIIEYQAFLSLDDFKFNIVENETSQTYVVENYRKIFNVF